MANKTVNGLGLISSFAVFLPSYLVTEDLAYDPDQLDRQVVTPDQIRTVVRTYKDKVLTEIFPGRTWVPKTLIFAKDDSHAEDIVKIVREEFAKRPDTSFRAGTRPSLSKRTRTFWRSVVTWFLIPFAPGW